MELPLDDQAVQARPFAVTGVDRATEYVPGQSPEDAKQRTNADGVPLWDFFCTVQDGRRVTNFKVRIPVRTPPEIDGPGRIRFGGLRASTYPDGNRNVVTFAADTWVVGDPPSASRATPPPPPDTPSPAKRAA